MLWPLFCQGKLILKTQKPLVSRARETAEEIIEFLEIEAIRDLPVGTLSYGLQKRVELGRALAMQPRLLLLDEMVSD